MFSLIIADASTEQTYKTRAIAMGSLLLRRPTHLFVLSALLAFVAAPASAQSTSIINLGERTTPGVLQGLRFNTGDNEMEYTLAAAAGATGVRIGSCGWGALEIQSAPPNNRSGGYSLPINCRNDIVWAVKNGMVPEVEAIFGAPYHKILTLTLSSAAAVGSDTLAVTFSSGVGGDTLANITASPTIDYVHYNFNLSNKHSYAGTLVTGYTSTSARTGTITLASALTTALPAGAVLLINEQLYPPTGSGYYASSPSDQAYVHYAEHLGELALALAKANGGSRVEVGIWNEPPWGGDCWDNALDCYDTPPEFTNPLQAGGQNFGFIAGLQDQTAPPPGITYISDLTDKSSSPNLLGQKMLTYTGEKFKNTAANPVTTQSFHPYGNNPEDAMWNEAMLKANPALGQHTNLLTFTYSNAVGLEVMNLQALAAGAFGIHSAITETGTTTAEGPTSLTELEKARFIMRQFVEGMWMNLDNVNFYRLYDMNQSGGTILDSGFSFVLLNYDGKQCTGSGTCTIANGHTALPAYTAISGLMADVKQFPSVPKASYSSLPAPSSYTGGSYPLAYGYFIGAAAGSSENSYMLVAFQMSYVNNGQCPSASSTSSNCWFNLASPARAVATWPIPAGTRFAGAVDLVTRLPEPSTVTASSVSISVGDDPVGVSFTPIE